MAKRDRNQTAGFRSTDFQEDYLHSYQLGISYSPCFDSASCSPQKKRAQIVKPQDHRAWLLLTPAFAIMLIVGFIPLAAALNYSFFDLLTIQDAFWVGDEWYRNIVTSSRFYASLARSLLFSLVVIFVQFSVGIALGRIMSRMGSSRILFLMLVSLPLVVPWNMIAMMWQSLINEKTGLIGQGFAAFGIGFDYKFNSFHTWILLVIMDTWHWLGLVVILAYAGFSGIPKSYYQAAVIDGASEFAIFRYIEFPKVLTTLSIALLLRFVDSFMINTEAFQMNAGGPHNATTFLSLDLNEDIKGFNYGPAAARSMIYFLLIITIAWIFRIWTERRALNDLSVLAETAAQRGGR